MKRFHLTLTFTLLIAAIATAQKPPKVDYVGGKCIDGDCLNGYGTFVFFDSKDKYEGEWKDGKMHGQGTYTFGNGEVYSGQYFNDERHGYGTYRWPSKDTYIGDYQHNKRNGYGMYIDAFGNKQEGFFENGRCVKPIKTTLAQPYGKTLEPVAVEASETIGINWLTPSIEDVSMQSFFDFKACIDTKSDIQSVEVYVNNQEYVAARGFSVDEEGECANIVKRTVQLQEGENTITLKVKTAKGSATSQSKTITYRPEASAETAPVDAGGARTALIIGNADYGDIPLKNPVNDAMGMAKTLEGLGFEVILLTNADQMQMKKAFREFGSKIKANGGTGMFYFSGHGIQAGGNNFLLPVGADITKEEDIEFEAVDIGRMLVEMEFAANPMNIIVLDACRDNPYADKLKKKSGSGLTAIERVPSGTFIAYSTAPGSVASDGVGDNGLYTQELLKLITKPGLRIEDVFKQVRANVRKMSGGAQIPWENSSIEADFFFKK